MTIQTIVDNLSPTETEEMLVMLQRRVERMAREEAMRLANKLVIALKTTNRNDMAAELGVLMKKL